MSDTQQCEAVSAACPVEATTYGYYPNLGVNIFFATFFGLCLVAQIPLTIRTKTWTYAIGLGIGTLLEFLGYIGRIQMHYNPWNESAFEMQICCLVLAPSFIAASIYLTLKHLVLHYGPEHSRLKPKWYPIIFVGCDFGSIVLQAIGGGIAASAGHGGSQTLLDAGDNLIVAGIAFQVGTMVVCGVLVVDYLLRLKKAGRSIHVKSIAGSPNDSEEEKVAVSASGSQTSSHSLPKLTIFWSAVVFAYFTVLIRCIYRLPEMVGGWGNPRMRRENEFLLLDGMMVAFAVLSLTIAHPGYFFPAMQKGKRAVPRTTDPVSEREKSAQV